MHVRPAAFAAAPATTGASPGRDSRVPSYLQPAGQVGTSISGTDLPRFTGGGPIMEAAPRYAPAPGGPTLAEAPRYATIAPLGGGTVPIPPGSYTPTPTAPLFPTGPLGPPLPAAPPAAPVSGFTIGAVALGVLAAGAGLALYHATRTRTAAAPAAPATTRRRTAAAA